MTTRERVMKCILIEKLMKMPDCTKELKVSGKTTLVNRKIVSKKEGLSKNK